MTTIDIDRLDTSERLPVITQQLAAIGGAVATQTQTWPELGTGWGQWSQEAADTYDWPTPFTTSVDDEFDAMIARLSRWDEAADRIRNECDMVSAEIRSLATPPEPESDAQVIDAMPDAPPVADHVYDDELGWIHPDVVAQLEQQEQTQLIEVEHEPVDIVRSGLDAMERGDELRLPERPSRWRRFVVWLTRRAEDAEAF